MVQSKFKLITVCIFYFVLFSTYIFAEDGGSRVLSSQSIVVNGDNVEYLTETQEVTATGNVEIIYGGARLTCKKLTVNTQTKQGVAEGDARLEDENGGVVEGEKITYDFQAKTGTIIDAGFRANPYFGKARIIERLGEWEFVARYGYLTTCSFDRPHYRIASKQMSILPGDKIKTKEDILYLGGFPLLYLPRFNHTLEDPMMHVRLTPGKSKDWGPYMLSAWRYSLADKINGRAYLDYRNKLGWAEGFGLNYATTYLGKGDLKVYYTQEKPDNLPSTATRSDFERYLIRWRHKWVVDDQTNFISELYKIGDQKRKYLDANASFLKDYFYREYEKDSQPLSYALFHHSFSYSSLDILAQDRVNHWYDQLSKLPEVKYTLPSIQLGDTPLYFENNSVLTNFNKKATTAPVSPDEVSVTRFDIINKFSMPMKVAFFEFVPFVKNREVIYDKGANGKSLPVNTIFYAGADLSTKFYRIFNVKSNFLGLGLNGLRHIVTPTVGYSYNHAPTINNYNLKQIDSVDLLTSSNAANLGLSNKLQVKRKDKNGKEVSVDLLDLNVSTRYSFAPQIVYGLSPYTQYDDLVVDIPDINKEHKRGASFSDIFVKYKILPYSWLRIEGDLTYKHSGVDGDENYENYNHLSNVNYDISFDFAPERSFGLGQRYERKGGNQLTASLNWRLNPKWKFSFYQRYNFKAYADSTSAFIKRGSLEQEFTLSRDLHCWEVDLTLNNKRNEGTGLYLVFRLKAFPELELSMNQTYNKPESGAQ
jgi:lipopolysaccharide assembly outer membrane protein LptD (OstA)